jgi:hypothetical protein
MLVFPYIYNAEVILLNKRKKDLVTMEDYVYYNVPSLDENLAEEKLLFKLKYNNIIVPYYLIDDNIISPIWNSYYYLIKYIKPETDLLMQSIINNSLVDNNFINKTSNLSSVLYRDFFIIDDFSQINKSDYIPLNLDILNIIFSSKESFLNPYSSRNQKNIFHEEQIKHKFSNDKTNMEKQAINCLEGSRVINKNIFLKTDNIPVYRLDLKKKKITIVSDKKIISDENKENIFYFQLNHKQQMIEFLKRLECLSFDNMKDFNCDIICGIDYVSDIYPLMIIQQIDNIMDKIIDKKYFWNYSKDIILHIFEWTQIKSNMEKMNILEKAESYFLYFNSLSKLMDKIDDNKKPLLWQQKNELFKKIELYSRVCFENCQKNNILNETYIKEYCYG